MNKRISSPRNRAAAIAATCLGAAAAAVAAVALAAGGGAASADAGTASAAAPSGKSYDGDAVRDGQARPAGRPVELAPAVSLWGRTPVLVGFRDTDNNLCLGWAASDETGLPSACDPRPQTRDHAKLRAYQFASRGPSLDDPEARVVWGSAPPQTSQVSVVSTQGATRYPVSASDASEFRASTYFAVVLPAESAPTSVVAYDGQGREISRQDLSG